ncbi:flagellar basal body rod protein FlgB [[Clostridium] polysaccharolyticum]|uniref:Flagellar basal body rod protein FlgB n=1 Tax=[Clostridium] polysaccharolyticum TaxID=29364 RepID=A0A1H9Y2W8_9FIRM|nr:flagellar basal body rod protein FlgB [[Clostridium] polysaccharolyticum]SES62653.1 flagellar basal-body rod protein FlgB [[Clostridium] polysaccharolyticum]
MANMFSYVDVLGKTADASWTRMEVIQDNIANVSTPKYKRKDVQFESYLAAQICDGDNLNECVDNIDLNSLQATTYVDNSQYSYRYDGNNVDIDTENSEMAKTQIRYQTLMESLTSEYSRIKTALSKS